MPVADAAVVRGAARRLAVVVHAVGVRQQPQPVDALGRAVEGGERLGEPAQRAGASARTGRSRAARPRRGSGRSRARARRPAATRRCRRRRRSGPARAGARRCPLTAAARSRRNSDRWLGSQRAGETRGRSARRSGRRRRRRSARSRPSGARPRSAQHVVVEERVARLHREPSTSERHDLGQPFDHPSHGRRRRAGCAQTGGRRVTGPSVRTCAANARRSVTRGPPRSGRGIRTTRIPSRFAATSGRRAHRGDRGPAGRGDLSCTAHGARVESQCDRKTPRGGPPAPRARDRVRRRAPVLGRPGANGPPCSRPTARSATGLPARSWAC